MGELRSLEDHLKTCGYVKIPCPNKCIYRVDDFNYNCTLLYGGEFKIFRKDLQKHLNEVCPHRTYTCPHCGKTGEYGDIIRYHQITCPKMKISCSNDECKKTFLRENEQDHLSICPYQKVICKYKDFGCEVTLLRKDLAAHERDDTAHLRMTMDTVLMLKTQLHTMHLQLNQNHSTKPVAPFLFKVPKFTEKKDKYFSPSFFTHPQGYKMTIRIYISTFTISVHALPMKGEYDDDLEFPFKGTITFELLNQLNNENHCKKSYTFRGTEDASKRVTGQERAGEGCGAGRFISLMELGFNPTKNCQYLKDDCLVFRISAEVPSYKPWLHCTAHAEN